MTSIILSIAGLAFDMVTVMLYFNHILKDRKKEIPLFIYWGGFLLMEAMLATNMFLSAGNTSLLKIMVTLFLSTASTFALTFFYNAPLRHRCFVALSFQVMASLGEFIFAIIITYTNPYVFEAPDMIQDTILEFGSKIITFILVCITNILFIKKKKALAIKYNLLLLLTPLISMTVIAFFPVTAIINTGYGKFSLLSLAGILFLNAINYYLLNHVMESHILNEKVDAMENQLLYQSEKFQQLSEAYRSTRSIVHDTKKHLFYIKSCLNNEKYEKISETIDHSITDLESKYIKINTGNLVIDTFVGNYLNLAQKEEIEFITKIKVLSDDIPVGDYDLCIILGNLLDNSLQACRLLPTDKQRFILTQIATTEKFFVVHIVNPLVPRELMNDSKSQLFHGYGIENVKKITEKYDGTYTCLTEKYYDVSVIIPILRDSFGVRLGSSSGNHKNILR